MTGSITAQVQLLDPGPELVFYQLDSTGIGGGVLRFHGQNDSTLTFQGIDYDPWPITATGFAKTGGQQPSPTLAVGNVGGSISFLCMAYEDLVGSILTRHVTYKKFLDGQPDADPAQEFPPDIWFIDRKKEETDEVVTFELASALDFADMNLPGRQIIQNFCPWIVIGGYRGEYCNYTGPAVAKADDTPTSDMLLDKCGGRRGSCALRQWPDNILNFGGFPAAGLVRT